MSRKINSELVSVSPKKMIFYAPYDRTQRRLISIMNPTANSLLYKIRSNAPWKYSASPNCGFIEPYGISEINVSLNYLDFHADQEYCHRFCVQCIPAPPIQQLQNQSILCIFKQTGRSMIHNVRVPVELQPEPIRIPQQELDTLLPYDVQKLLWNLRPLGSDYIDHLKQVTMLKSQKKRRGWARLLMTSLIIISTLTGAYLHRQQFKETLNLHLKMDNLQC
ncbi:vesicle-associated membrane protein-associated protein A isoform X1 [Drosophila virilis]|uniref:MSP domain-containing protein n=1 Tax=Drosophila virilis TaxID=7244 RepID=B4LQN0_DROVI|nr:vesicle-associated membrane protein-associated protein A isoform X1 [Drosophila virilis]EDW64487.2 uncharacterized protein Dvir_GJ22303 [Drosophila virilis]